MSEPTAPQAIIVMGVCGTGKSVMGQKLAAVLNCHFAEARDCRPTDDQTELHEGIVIDDEKRERWMGQLRQMMEAHLNSDRSVVLACSALREDDRSQLEPQGHSAHFIYLHGNRDQLAERLRKTASQNPRTEQLDAELATLEVPSPTEALWCDATSQPDEIVGAALDYLQDS